MQTMGALEVFVWFIERFFIPLLTGGAGLAAGLYHQRKQAAREDRRERKIDANDEQNRNRREMDLIYEEWHNVRNYWQTQLESLRVEVKECRLREDECELREKKLQMKITSLMRWSANMVTQWNLEFPDNPVKMPEIDNGHGVKHGI